MHGPSKSPKVARAAGPFVRFPLNFILTDLTNIMEDFLQVMRPNMTPRPGQFRNYLSEMISRRARVKRDWMKIEEAKFELDGEDEDMVRGGGEGVGFYMLATKRHVHCRGVMIPFFTGIGIGITTKGVGIGIAWNRLFVGIDSSSGIDSTIRINSTT